MQYLKTEVREKIISAAVLEFKEHGFSDASIRNIADNAEISLGNIYRYFTNKEALYLAVVNPFIDNMKIVIKNEFNFLEKSTKEISEVLVSFLMEYCDELMIIQKGNSVHYDGFISYIVEAISEKVQEMLVKAFPEIGKKIKNPYFYDAIANSFLICLFDVLDSNDEKEIQERNAREVIAFFFSSMQSRFSHFEEE